MKTLIRHQMQHDTWFSAMCGAIGGTSYYIFMDVAYLTRLFEAGLTAFVCGLIGAAGKHLYDKLKNKKNGSNK
jgi:hypothetical protein